MANPGLTEEMLHEALDAYVEHDGCKQAAADSLGIHVNTFKNRLRNAQDQIGEKPKPIATDLPPSDIPTGDIIDMMCRRFGTRHEHAKAKRWRKFTVPTSGPYALMLFGDPHVDDNGCNWPLLRSHCELAAATEHLYAISVGDVTNNWTGRLMKLYADQDTSLETARTLIRWLLNESGVP